MNDDTAAGAIDREGIAMLYAAGTGAIVATSLIFVSEPASGWALGSIVVLFGLVYELDQRKQHTDTDIERGRKR